MLLRLAYLGVTNAFAMPRLLPTSGREKDVEILALRHQIGVLERQLNGQQVRFHASDRAFLASLLQGLPRKVLRRMRLLVKPDTVLRWHRNVIARRHAAQSRPKRGGRPRITLLDPGCGHLPSICGCPPLAHQLLRYQHTALLHVPVQ
ncbi:hypothetical protein [Streptomyces sp. NPDC058441]|uniref:hypothetical protein n=1 Tax=Streptomyces sp. NPDC058441 TaxID=3346502 RepID=UPI00365F0A40